MCKNEFCYALLLVIVCIGYVCIQNDDGEYNNCNLITWIINLSLIIWMCFGTKLMMIHQFCGIISIIRISYLITFAKQLFVCAYAIIITTFEMKFSE